MTTASTWTKDETIERIRAAAVARGGWLSCADYYKTPPATARPAIATLGKWFNCAPSWSAICAVIGVASCHEEILGATLTETDMQLMSQQTNTTLGMYTHAHRQQLAVWSIQRAHAYADGELTKARYAVIAKQYGLVSFHVVEGAFGGLWNRALEAAGLPVNYPRSPHSFRGAAGDIAQQHIVDDLRSHAVPANWRTHDVYLQTLEPVTDVTMYVMANGLGLKHTEVRACLR